MLKNRNVRDYQRHAETLRKWIDGRARVASIDDLTLLSEMLVEVRKLHEIEGEPTPMSRAAAGCFALNEFVVGKTRGQDLPAYMFAEMQDQDYRLTWFRFFSDAYVHCDRLGVPHFKAPIEAIIGITFLIDMETRIPWAEGVVE